MLQCEVFYSNLSYYFEIPNGENVGNWVVNVVLKLNNNPTANEIGIVVLPRQFLGFCGKLKCYNAKGFPLISDMTLKFPTVRTFGIGLRT